jgi:uncharacterized Zn finger protein
MVTAWQSMCPNCGETVFVGLGYPYFQYTLHCEQCGVVWTMTELEVYELSHPSKETVDIVNKLMELSYKLAMEERH